jgi:hypothetical protein
VHGTDDELAVVVVAVADDDGSVEHDDGVDWLVHDVLYIHLHCPNHRSKRNKCHVLD